jgi:hypothetical protein
MLDGGGIEIAEAEGSTLREDEGVPICCGQDAATGEDEAHGRGHDEGSFTHGASN